MTTVDAARRADAPSGASPRDHSPAGAPALIQIERLTKLYRMGEHTVRALDGVDLSIGEGEFVAIIGPSGSGKSTMMHLLGCLDRPTSGRYVLSGRDVSRMSDRALAQVRNERIGFVFQTFNLINRTSAVDNVGVPLFYARKPNTRGPARRALERVGLTARRTHRPSELSGGERQRVAIARAIVNDPVLLLADEPTGNLDSRTGEQIMEIFHDLNRQGVTIVIVTHEPDVALQARRIVAMRDGRIVSDRVTREMIEEAEQAGIAPAALLYRPPGAPPDPPVESVGRAAADVGAAGARASVHSGTAPGHAGAPASPVRIAESARTMDLPVESRPLRGALASLVWVVLAVLCYLGGAYFGAWVVGAKPDWKKPESVPAPVMQAAALAAAGYLLYWVFGLLGLISGARALNRAREPGVLHTRKWFARLGLIGGILIVLSPLGAYALGRLMR